MSPARHPVQSRFIWFRRKCLGVLHWHGRALIWLGLAVILLWGAVAAGLQWWVFPRLESYRPALVAELSQRVGRPVSVAEVRGGWRNASPYLDLRQLSLHHSDGRPALTLPEVEATLSWWPLLLGDLRFARLTVVRPDLELTRETDGSVRLAGLPLDQGGDDTLSNWVLRQHDIAIVDATVTWRDHARAAPPLVLQHVEFSLENQLFGRHRASLNATPPVALASPFRAEARWRGDDMARFSSWQGDIQARLQHVDLGAWSRWVPFPFDLRRGRGNLDIDLDFSGWRATAIKARFDLAGVSLRLAPELERLDVDGLSAALAWQDHDGERELALSQLKLTAEGGKLLDGSQASLRLDKRGGGEFNAAGLTLPALGKLPPALPLPRALHRQLAGMQPTGRLDRVRWTWRGDWREPTEFGGRAGFTGLGLIAQGNMPTLGPLDGEVDFTHEAGNLSLRSQGFRLSAAGVFEDALQFDRFRAGLDWQRAGRGWVVSLRDFLATNTDLDATATARWSWPGEGMGELRLDGRVARLSAAKVADYLPTELGPDTRHWLRTSLLAGEARNARFELDGPLAGFPHADGKTGVWKVSTEAHGLTLDYANGWPPMTGIDGRVDIVGNRLSVEATGQIAGTRVTQAKALIEDLAHSTEVQIDGEVSGATADYLSYIARSPLDASLGHIGSQARASGDGQLSLKLAIPFEDTDATRVSGRYRFAGNRLQIGEDMPELTGFGGEISFTEQSVGSRNLGAQVLGGPVRLDLSSATDAIARVKGTGRVDAQTALRRYGVPFAERVSGQTDYRIAVSLLDQGWQMSLEAPMRDVRIDLPAPLAKPTGEVRPLRVQLSADAQREQWGVVLGNTLNVALRRTQQQGVWRTERGEIFLGNGTPNAANRGLWVSANLPELALDPWLALLDSPAASSQGETLAGLEIKTVRLSLLGSQIDDTLLRALPQADRSWLITMSSKQIEGKGSWSPQGKGTLNARLNRLLLPLPDAPDGAATDNGQQTELPALDVVAEDFRYRAHPLGKLEVRAQQQRENWLIDTLTLSNPDGRLAMQGVWRTGGGENATNMKLDVSSDNIGKLLARMGYAETVSRGSGALKGELAWQGSPLAPHYPSMTGSLKLQASNGQFAKVNPGMGRLLGILSLQALPRRLTLDFRDIFSEGFAFDRIEGDSKIVKGVASTENLSIVGPSAQVLFKGEADLGRETQKLRVRIVPTIGDSVAVGAGVALANPALAVGAFLLQRALRDPLGRLIAYEYDITGGWDDPQVSKVGAVPAK
ncbi:YhdP family protein [Chitinimonas sp. BJYL2]|uniref:YhdP family protein n=1 Tax=Chitinimonas sp. BJYL2 TaxID=2976696 RepID=UPI0022B51361|nr:YhdP family protein [Chitinimonas sp. BJYL2]